MKTLSAFLIASLSLVLISASCNPKNGSSGNTVRDSVPVEDTTLLPTGGVRPLPGNEDTATLPTGGVKPVILPAKEVERKLVAQYERGEVEKCLREGVVFYKCSRNAYDAGSEVFDSQGNRVGRCYPSTRIIDPICEQITDCKTIYRIAKNIWGKPEVKWE